MPDTVFPFRPLQGSALVHALLRAGLIAPERYLEALRTVRDDRFWRHWGRRVLLALAVGQILAGIVFFFAFNWADLPPFAKLGVIQAGIVICTLGAWLGRNQPIAWEALLTAACVLVGVLLAVFGQIYQTGADAYTLFVGWAALILPWVLASRALVPWAVWLVVTGAGAVTYAVQIAIPLGWISLEGAVLLLALFYGFALLVRETAMRYGIPWLRPLWPRRLLVAAILTLTLSTAVSGLFESVIIPDGWMAVAGYSTAAIGLGIVCVRLLDLPAVLMAVLSGCLFLTAAGGRIVFEWLDPEVGAFSGLVMLVLAVFGSAFALLRRLRDWMAAHD